MKKSFYTTPSKKDLKVGNILPIYHDYTISESLRGNAELLEHRPSSWKNENDTFIRAFVGKRGEDGTAIVWKAQRWVVRFVDGKEKGHRTGVYIGFFHSFSLDNNESEEE